MILEDFRRVFRMRSEVLWSQLLELYDNDVFYRRAVFTGNREI